MLAITLRTVGIKTTSSEWFDREIAGKLSLRDKLFKKFKSSRLNIDWEIYKKTRNDVQRLIEFKKKKYFEVKLAENIAKPKKLWLALKSLGLPNKKTSQSNICLKNIDGFLFNSFSIAETFKKYNSSLAENLVLKLPKPSNNFGIDDLSGIFLKDGENLLTAPITQLCNLSISSGIFPDACKIAKLKALFKKVLERIQRTTVQSHFCHLSPMF